MTPPLDEMSAFEAVAILRRSLALDGASSDRWKLCAFAFLGRRASLRWARVSLRYARIAFENGERVEGIGWLMSAERWRETARDYPDKAGALLRTSMASRSARREARAE